MARDIAARSAYAQAPAIEVQAGYEEVAQHVWVPTANDATLPRDLVPHPMIYLAFAGPEDTRPGVSYFSLAPGRIVIVRGALTDPRGLGKVRLKMKVSKSSAFATRS